jgi:hypothetical protein
MNQSPRLLALVPALALLAACSSSSEGNKAAVSPDAGKGTGEKYLGLEMPTNGFQVRSNGTDIQPGEDVEYCEIGELPGTSDTTYYVNDLEFANGQSSHHLIIDAALPDTQAETRLAGMKVGDRVECLSSQAAFGDGFEFVGGVQRPYGDIAFPEGVGRVYHGGQRFVFDYHYYNTTEKVVPARSAVNFHLTKEADVKHIARVVGFYNFTIDTPPGEKSSFIGECRYKQDVMVPGLTRHTHRWGTDFSTWFAGGPHDGEHIWTSTNFQEDTNHPFDAPLLVKKGEGFRFQCDYQNTENQALRFGPNARDEMCILFSLAWDAGDAMNIPDQDCQIVQIGDDGIGRGSDGQAFRPPTATEITACSATPNTGLSAECQDCACKACGGVITDCTNDADCKPILDCVQTSGCNGQACAGVCGSVINDHSSGTGLLISLSSCLGASCPNCTGGAADSAAP